MELLRDEADRTEFGSAPKTREQKVHLARRLEDTGGSALAASNRGGSSGSSARAAGSTGGLDRRDGSGSPETDTKRAGRFTLDELRARQALCAKKRPDASQMWETSQEEVLDANIASPEVEQLRSNQKAASEGRSFGTPSFGSALDASKPQVERRVSEGNKSVGSSEGSTGGFERIASHSSELISPTVARGLLTGRGSAASAISNSSGDGIPRSGSKAKTLSELQDRQRQCREVIRKGAKTAAVAAALRHMVRQASDTSLTGREESFDSEGSGQGMQLTLTQIKAINEDPTVAMVKALNDQQTEKIFARLRDQKNEIQRLERNFETKANRTSSLKLLAAVIGAALGATLGASSALRSLAADSTIGAPRPEPNFVQLVHRSPHRGSPHLSQHLRAKQAWR